MCCFGLRTVPLPGPLIRPAGRTAFRRRRLRKKLIEIESLLHGQPWLSPGATATRGNNCIAYADRKSPDGLSAGDVLAKITAPLTFDTKYDHTKSSAATITSRIALSACSSM